mgnify:CR=1 FL=1
MKQFVRNFVMGFLLGGMSLAAWNASAAQAAVATSAAHASIF